MAACNRTAIVQVPDRYRGHRVTTGPIVASNSIQPQTIAGITNERRIRFTQCSPKYASDPRSVHEQTPRPCKAEPVATDPAVQPPCDRELVPLSKAQPSMRPMTPIGNRCARDPSGAETQIRRHALGTFHAHFDEEDGRSPATDHRLVAADTHPSSPARIDAEAPLGRANGTRNRERRPGNRRSSGVRGRSGRALSACRVRACYGSAGDATRSSAVRDEAARTSRHW